MSRPNTTGKQDQQRNGSQADPSIDLIEQAEALKQTLKSSVNQVNDIIAAAKQQKKQARAVASTIAALSQLEHVA